jgi:protein TonB
MFDYAATGRGGARRARWATGLVSALAHTALVGGVALATVSASGALPEPRSVMAFVVSAPAPPPPPPPPAPVVEAKRAAKPAARKVARPAAPRPVAPAPIAAPLAAPDGIVEETGLEGGEFTASRDYGFEHGVPGGVPGGVLGGIEAAPPPPPPAPPRLVRVGGDITAPRLRHRVDPEYPLVAQSAQVEGVVILEATVNRVGRVEDIRVLRAHALLQTAAIDAVKAWQYEPLMLNGQPTPFVLTVTVSFSLPTR